MNWWTVIYRREYSLLTLRLAAGRDDDDDDDDNKVCKMLLTVERADDDWDFDALSGFSARYSPAAFNSALT